MYYFATLFDCNYLSRGLVLRDSLRKVRSEFKLFILCLDELTYEFFEKEEITDTIPLRLCVFESNFPELLQVKGSRSWTEYIFTLSPFLPLYLLNNYPEIDMITTVDADLYFFSDPAVLFTGNEDASIMITPHRFSERHLKSKKYGLYNVSFQSFRRNETALLCLTDWKHDCLEWCSDRLEGDRFADQKYLDFWEAKYGKSVKVFNHRGAGLAPWNIEDSCLEKIDNVLFADGARVIFYHFHHLRIITPRLISSGLSNYSVPRKGLLLSEVYAPYIGLLRRFSKETGMGSDKAIRYYSGFSFRKLKKQLLNSQIELYINSSKLLPVSFF